MTITHKFPIGSTIVKKGYFNDPYQKTFKIKAHSYNGFPGFYEFEKQPCAGHYANIQWTEENYELEKPKFKFPIGSKISWNINPKEIYLVNGFDYEKDQYILEATQDAIWSHKKGFKFPYTRILTETYHKLIPNEEPKMEWKFKIGDKILYNNGCVKEVYDISSKGNYYITKAGVGYSLFDKEFTETNFVLYVECPKVLPRCIPPNPQVSGWHWISSIGWTDSRVEKQPRYWNAAKQLWCRNLGSMISKAITPQEAYVAQWVYDKPCNY